MGTVFVDNIKHQSAQGSGTITIGASGETVSFGSGVTGINYPAFEATINGNQSITDASNTKISFDLEILDTDSCYDATTNYRFTPTVAGKYFVSLQLHGSGSADDTLKVFITYLYKNGSRIARSGININQASSGFTLHSASPIINTTVDMNGSTDYLEAFGYVDVTSGTPQINGTSATNTYSRFSAFRIG